MLCYEAQSPNPDCNVFHSNLPCLTYFPKWKRMVCERVSHLFWMSCWLKANKWLWCNSAASGSIFSQFVFKILSEVLTSHISLPPQSWGSVQWIYSLAARRASLGGQLSLATFLVRSEEPVSRTDACDPSLEDAIYNLQNLGRRPRTCLYETVVWDIEPRMLRIRKKMVSCLICIFGIQNVLSMNFCLLVT